LTFTGPVAAILGNNQGTLAAAIAGCVRTGALRIAKNVRAAIAEVALRVLDFRFQPAFRNTPCSGISHRATSSRMSVKVLFNPVENRNEPTHYR
jgi:hypothetical protein